MGQRRLTASCGFADYRTVLLKNHQKKKARRAIRGPSDALRLSAGNGDGR
jgi:hypothetical protein